MATLSVSDTHSPCTWGHIFNPPACLVCREPATAVFTLPTHLTVRQLQLLWARWRNLQILALHNKRSLSLADPQLPVCLGLARRSASPTPSLSHLLMDTFRMKQTFEGLPSSAVTLSQPPEVRPQPQPQSENHPQTADMTQSADPLKPPRKSQQTGCHHKKNKILFESSATPSVSPPRDVTYVQVQVEVHREASLSATLPPQPAASLPATTAPPQRSALPSTEDEIVLAELVCVSPQLHQPTPLPSSDVVCGT